MKLANGFITHLYKNEQLMVAVGQAGKSFHGLVRSNETAAFIIDQLKDETSEESIVERLTERYDVDRETASQDVHSVIEQLRQIGAICE